MLEKRSIEKYFVEDILVSPDSKYLITSHHFFLPRERIFHDNGYIICWDLETKQRLFTLEPKNVFTI
jgi:hypothetical protein